MSDERRHSFEIAAEFQKKKDAITMAKEMSDLKIESSKASGKKLTKAEQNKIKNDELKKEMNITEHKEAPEAVLAKLEVASIEAGLTTPQVHKKTELEGPNRMTPPATVPEWKKFLDQQTGFFSLLLWFGSALCFFGYFLKREDDNLYLGIVLAVVVFGTGVFSYLQEKKGSDLMESFKSLMPEECTVTRDSQSMVIDAIQLVRGDIIKLKGGDKVPADCLILAASDDFEVDNASLTGESEAVKRSSKFTSENPLETANLVFFGTQIPKGTMTGIVINTGDNTVMGRIAQLTTSTETEDTPIAKEIHHFIKIVSGVALFLGVTFGIIGFLLGTDNITNLVFMIGIIVANVPEGLLATVTVCLTLTANRMASKQVLVKNLEGVETLGSTTCICSDKTGTLTQNIMTVAACSYDVVNYQAPCTLYKESNLNEKSETFTRLLRIAALCNNAVWDAKSQKKKDGSPIPFAGEKLMGDGSMMKTVFWKPIGDASESALLKFAQSYMDVGEYRDTYMKLKEIPFNSANKYQVSIHSQDGREELIKNPDAKLRTNEDGSPKGDLLVMKGAPERITSRCSHIMINGELKPFDAEQKKKVDELQRELSRNGLRVLGFCEKELDPKIYDPKFVYDASNPNFPLGECWENPKELKEREVPAHENMATPLTFIGLYALIDPPRVQVPGAVEKCKTSGIRVIMVTGDHPETAKAIAQKVGIIWGKTADDIEYENEKGNLKEGSDGWQDPALADAIVVPGWDINLDTPQEVWDDILSHSQVVFARTSPQQKLIIVENNQRRKEIVAVTGDGVNDAPALRKADIGVAMGIMGSAVSKDAADMILLDDNFASIVQGVEEGRLIFDNLKKSIAYTLSSNIPEIMPFLIFIVLKVPLPLSTVLILLIDLGTDMIPAISMAWEQAESDIMKRPPRDSDVDRLVTRKLIFFAYLQIGVIQAAAGFFTWMVVMNDYGYPPQMLINQGANENWGKHMLWCSVGKEFGTGGFDASVFKNVKNEVGTATTITGAISNGFFFFDGGKDLPISECTFPSRNYIGDGGMPSNWVFGDAATYTGATGGVVVPTNESILALNANSNKWFPYMPLKGRDSPFFKTEWLTANVNDGKFIGLGGKTSDFGVFMSHQPAGLWVAGTNPLGGEDGCALAVGYGLDSFGGITKCYTAATFTDATMTCGVASNSECVGDWSYPALTTLVDGKVSLNIASRMMQKEALAHAQCSYFVSIVVVQWADLIICKTRMNSLYHQGMANSFMNFGLVFEVILAAFFCYLESDFNYNLGVRPLRLVHWFPAVPFSCIIVMYDELRKYMMRKTTEVTVDDKTMQVFRDPGWLERNSYY